MIASKHKLLTAEREQRIMQLLRASDVVSVAALSEQLGASEATVRRDLETLQEKGMLRRVHGGASIVGSKVVEPIFKDKEALYTDEKLRIAQAALNMISDKDVIFLDGGSTVLMLTRLLSAKKNLTIVTNSLMAAAELQDGPHKLVLTGGEFRGISRTMVGTLTAPILESLRFDKAFMGTIGFSVESGMSTTDPGEAFTKRLAMKQAKQVILLADHSKLGATSFMRSGLVADVDVLISDEVGDEQRKALTQEGVRVVIV